MHKMVVLYHEPADHDHFRDYYVTNHLPLATRMPGLLAWRYSFEVAATQGQTPYFAVFEAEFADAEAMTAARASPQGQLVAADVANYATGGSGLLPFPVQDGPVLGRTVRPGAPSVRPFGQVRPSGGPPLPGWGWWWR